LWTVMTVRSRVPRPNCPKALKPRCTMAPDAFRSLP
jgi:hypothetical protein